MIDLDDEDTLPTEDHEALAELRAALGAVPSTPVQWAGGSRTGTVRSANEDRWVAAHDRVFAVADGMGGHVGGEAAAQAVVDAVAASAAAMSDVGAQFLVHAANTAVRRVQNQLDADHAGATLVLVGIDGNVAEVASVGDSRLYRLRGGVLQAMTRDQNVRNELEDNDLPMDALGETVRLDALTAYIGMDGSPPAAQCFTMSVEPGDRLLLTTDGVHGQVTQTHLANTVMLLDPVRAVTELLDAADEAGGRDNATAVIIEIGRTPAR
jgi:protein phosphatase